MTCKGICKLQKANKPHGMGRYAAGQKRCQICELFMQVEGFYCPCCGYKLRCKPRGQKYKALLIEHNQKIISEQEKKSKKVRNKGLKTKKKV